MYQIFLSAKLLNDRFPLSYVAHSVSHILLCKSRGHQNRLSQPNTLSVLLPDASLDDWLHFYLFARVSEILIKK